MVQHVAGLHNLPSNGVADSTKLWKGGQGGHAPEPLREAFRRYVRDFASATDAELNTVGPDEGRLAFSDPARQAWWTDLTIQDRLLWLAGQLWDCTDVLPDEFHSQTQMVFQTHTYASLARLVHSVLSGN